MEHYELDTHSKKTIAEAKTYVLAARRKTSKVVSSLIRQRREAYIKEGHTGQEWARFWHDKCISGWRFGDEGETFEKTNLEMIMDAFEKLDGQLAIIQYLLSNYISDNYFDKNELPDFLMKCPNIPVKEEDAGDKKS